MSTRVSPRISVNEMAKYLTATASQRRSIIRQQKDPVTFMTAMYTPATTAVTDYLSVAMSDESILRSAIFKIENAPTDTQWAAQRNTSCIAALKSVLLNKPDIDLTNLQITALPLNAQKYLQVGDVEISIRPENLITGIKRGKPVCGVVKQYICKTHILTKDEAGYLGALTYKYASENLSHLGKVSPNLCYVYDVFAGRIWQAPQAIARRIEDVEASCEEISRAWDDI